MFTRSVKPKNSNLLPKMLTVDAKVRHPPHVVVNVKVDGEEEKNYTMARTHFLHSRDGDGMAKMLIELHRSRGYTNEIDLFIAQVVLQCLCLRNKSTAVLAFQCYTAQHPCIDKGPPYLLPLLNFIWFLFQAIESGRLAVFTVLCEQYQLSIERDPTYTHYLNKIGQIFFGVPPPRSSNSNFLALGSLFESLLFSGEELEDDDVADNGGGRAGQSTRSPQAALATDDLD